MNLPREDIRKYALGIDTYKKMSDAVFDCIDIEKMQLYINAERIQIITINSFIYE